MNQPDDTTRIDRTWLLIGVVVSLIVITFCLAMIGITFAGGVTFG